MRPRRKRQKSHHALGKRAFITDVLVDFWAYILFVLISIVFFVIFKYSAEAKTQQIQDVRDIAAGNYLAQVYLRTPVNVAGTEMNMAELIAIYDYNQSLEKANETSFADFFINPTPILFMVGKPNPMLGAIDSITRDFVDKNFDDDRCFVFSIHGNSFEYVKRSTSCPGAFAFSMYYLFSQLPSVPNSTYITNIAPVDPRDKPILVYSIYDFERLLQIYSPSEYFDMSTAERWAFSTMCTMNPMAAIGYSGCREKIVAAVGEARK